MSPSCAPRDSSLHHVTLRNTPPGKPGVRMGYPGGRGTPGLEGGVIPGVRVLGRLGVPEVWVGWYPYTPPRAGETRGSVGVFGWR